MRWSRVTLRRWRRRTSSSSARTATPRPSGCGASPCRRALPFHHARTYCMNPVAAYLDPVPLIAVLRGISPEEVDDVAGVLVDAGFRILEVPLNSPRPYDSIRRLAQVHG